MAAVLNIDGRRLTCYIQIISIMLPYKKEAIMSNEKIKWYTDILLQDMLTLPENDQGRLEVERRREIICLLNLGVKPAQLIFRGTANNRQIEIYYELNQKTSFDAQVEADGIIRKYIDPLISSANSNLTLINFHIIPANKVKSYKQY